MANYVVSMKVTRIIMADVEAKSESEARRKAERLDFHEEQVLETTDWEVIDVEEEK